jgi:Iodothyronine deiodinase
VAFYVVYIQEAHPIDAWQDDDNIKAHIFLSSAHTVEDRCATASTCAVKLGLKIPAIIDNLSNSTERAYTAWPDRLYVIDRDGRVAYKSGAGPFGFHPEQAAAVLARLVGPASPEVRSAVAPAAPSTNSH